MCVYRRTLYTSRECTVCLNHFTACLCKLFLFTITQTLLIFHNSQYAYNGLCCADMHVLYTRHKSQSNNYLNHAWLELLLLLFKIIFGAPLCRRVNGESWERKLSRDQDVYSYCQKQAYSIVMSA